MTKILRYIVLFAIVLSVAASGSLGNTTSAPERITADDNKISSTMPMMTQETNQSMSDNIYMVGGMHVGTSQRNLLRIISRTNASAPTNTSGKVISLKSKDRMQYTSVVTNATKRSKNPFDRVGKNIAVAPETGKLTIIHVDQVGKLKIIPANKTATTTVNMGSAQRNALKILAAQKNTNPVNVTTTTTVKTMTVTVGEDGTVSVDNNTGNITVDTKK